MSPAREKKYLIAMGVYGLLAILAGFQMDGNIRLAVWIFLGGLAAKTWIGKLRMDQDDK